MTATESPAFACEHHWVHYHQPDFPKAIHWVGICDLCQHIDGAGLCGQIEALAVAFNVDGGAA
jgi:hypothetical protein